MPDARDADGRDQVDADTRSQIVEWPAMDPGPAPRLAARPGPVGSVDPSFEPEAIFAALNGAAVEYIVIGGIAATLRGSPLRTGDTDICPAGDLERLDTAIREVEAGVAHGTGGHAQAGR